MPSNSSEYMKEYYRKNPDKYETLKRRMREYKKTHKISKTQNRKSWVKSYRRLKNKIFVLLENKCSNPFNINHGDMLIDKRCLQIDHINGGGSREMKKFSCYYSYLKFVLEQIQSGSKDYQLLCANCNWIKKYENDENNLKP